jgi:hypothetical protein
MNLCYFSIARGERGERREERGERREERNIKRSNELFFQEFLN